MVKIRLMIKQIKKNTFYFSSKNHIKIMQDRGSFKLLKPERQN